MKSYIWRDKWVFNSFWFALCADTLERRWYATAVQMGILGGE